MTMRNFLINMAEIYHQMGMIGYDELRERVEVALWLSDNDKLRTDPRKDIGDADVPEEARHDDSVGSDSLVSTVSEGNGACSKNDEIQIEFLNHGIWVFTKSDPDSYPSVPHGHHTRQNNRWPKLNPYTGRVLKQKHQEDIGNRLSKRQMRSMWQDEKFKSFCREMVVWYQEQHPYFQFPVRTPLRMPRW